MVLFLAPYHVCSGTEITPPSLPPAAHTVPSPSAVLGQDLPKGSHIALTAFSSPAGEVRTKYTPDRFLSQETLGKWNLGRA